MFSLNFSASLFVSDDDDDDDDDIEEATTLFRQFSLFVLVSTDPRTFVPIRLWADESIFLLARAKPLDDVDEEEAIASRDVVDDDKRALRIDPTERSEDVALVAILSLFFSRVGFCLSSFLFLSVCARALKFSLFRYELVGKNDIEWMKTKTKIFAHLDFITSTTLSFFLSFSPRFPPRTQ